MVTAGETEAEMQGERIRQESKRGATDVRGLLSLSSLPCPPGELCDEVVDHCVPEMNLCQHEAKCISLDKGFR